MGKGSGGGTETVRTEQVVPKYIQDQTKETFNIIDAFKPRAYTGDRVAGFTPNQLLANQAIGSLALNNPLMGAATQGLGDIISGQFNVSDPLQTQINSNIANAVNDASSLYSRGGRLGSGAFGDALGEGITNASAPFLAQALENDAARKMSAIGAVPQMLQGELGLLGALGNVGGMEQALNQANLDAGAAKFGEGLAGEQQQINNLLAAIGQAPNLSGSLQTKTGGGTPQLNKGLGGALAGASLASYLPTSLAPTGMLSSLGLGGMGALMGGGLGLLGLI